MALSNSTPDTIDKLTLRVLQAGNNNINQFPGLKEDFDELERLGFINADSNGNFNFTKKGTDYLINNPLMLPLFASYGQDISATNLGSSDNPKPLSEPFIQLSFIGEKSVQVTPVPFPFGNTACRINHLKPPQSYILGRYYILNGS